MNIKKRAPGNEDGHYGDRIQPIDLIIDWKMDFIDGSIIKYVTRWKKKNGIEDLEKARWYIEKAMHPSRGLKQRFSCKISVGHYCREAELGSLETRIINAVCERDYQEAGFIISDLISMAYNGLV